MTSPEYYQANKERVLASNKAYRAANKERLAPLKKAYAVGYKAQALTRGIDLGKD